VSLEPPTEAGSVGADVVMVPSDEDSAPPHRRGMRRHDVDNAGAFSGRGGAGAFTGLGGTGAVLSRGGTEAFFSYGRRVRRRGDGLGNALTCGLSPASGSSTSTPLNSLATIGRC
jgi:hypothetical protein